MRGTRGARGARGSKRETPVGTTLQLPQLPRSISMMTTMTCIFSLQVGAAFVDNETDQIRACLAEEGERYFPICAAV